MNDFLFCCEDFGQFLQLPDNPRGAWKWLTVSVLHIPAAGMFSFLALLFGDPVTSSCIISWWQTNRFWDAQAHSMGGFWSPQKMQEVSVQRSSRWCIALGMNLLMCVCSNSFQGLFSGKQAYLGFEVKTVFCKLIVCSTPPPGQLSTNHGSANATRLNGPVGVWVFSKRWSKAASERCPPCKEFGGWCPSLKLLMWKKSCKKYFVTPEEAACNLINSLQWCRSCQIAGCG